VFTLKERKKNTDIGKSRQRECPRKTGWDSVKNDVMQIFCLSCQQDLESLNLSPNKAVDVAQNRSLSRMMSTFGATHSQWCTPEMNE